jgi:RNA polymerase sporulation-specific sigma factor
MINDLEVRDKEIILLRYFKDKTQSEVARILGISQVQVSRIEKKILNKMKRELIS